MSVNQVTPNVIWDTVDHVFKSGQWVVRQMSHRNIAWNINNPGVSYVATRVNRLIRLEEIMATTLEDDDRRPVRRDYKPRTGSKVWSDLFWARTVLESQVWAYIENEENCPIGPRAVVNLLACIQEATLFCELRPQAKDVKDIQRNLRDAHALIALIRQEWET